METQDGGIMGIELLIDNEAEECEIDLFFRKILSPEINKKKISIRYPWLSLSAHTRNHEHTFKRLVELTKGTHIEDKTYISYYRFEAPRSLEEYNLDVKVADGYRLGKVTAQQEDRVLKYWSAEMSGAFEAVNAKSPLYLVVHDNIAFRPTVAVFFKAEPNPVGWVTLYGKGTMGMLHVIEEHRRKGLASVLLRTMMREIIEECGAPVCATVSPSNGPSIKLLQSLNMKRVPHCQRMLYPIQ